MHYRERSPDHPPFRKDQLQQLLTWLIPVTFIFALLAEIAFVAFRDPAMGIGGTILLSYGILLLIARVQVRRNRRHSAITITCVGLLGATLVVVLFQPNWLPILVVTPLLAVMVALPYVGERYLLFLVVAGWAVTTIVAVLSQTLSPGIQTPLWFEKLFLIGSITMAVATVLLLLWQFRSRLTQMLSRTQAAEERYALAAQAANDGLWDWDLSTNHVYFSPRWKAMLSYEEREVGTRPEEWFGRVHPDDRAHVETRLRTHLAEATNNFESEYRIAHKDGHYRWMLARGVAVRNDDGKAVRIAGSQADITERKQVEQQLLHNALHDSLTSLPNRALFMDRLGEAIEYATKYRDRFFAVLFLDLDRFKNINDSLGHVVGDSFLVEIAHRLRMCLRSGSTVARLGGDEFAVLLNDINDVNDAIWFADRIQEELREPLNLHGYELSTTASIGVALGTLGYRQRPEDLLRDADTAMYRAKALGPGRCEVFDVEMHSTVMALLQLETDLRQAVEKEEFEHYYQPIVSLKTGKITGFEALLRWRHPQRGLIYPDEFLPVLEDIGLIVPVGWAMLEEACRQMRVWQERFPPRPPFTISVNFSGNQITQVNFSEQIERILRETGVDPRRVRLEITESAIMHDVKFATTMLSRLRELNVQLHIDDFGTGYSSLSALHRFPIDALKIDRLFVGMLGIDGENAELVQTITTLAHSLGMDVIAEGVESEAQLDYLRTLGCDYGQGYLFSEPVDRRTVATLIAKNPQW
jgi:diguanylate cyclase (GGDEF)-like protein/PAS domain S-box-containing protein